jgi:glycosyltransferase involved in cell wall biosynthesis
MNVLYFCEGFTDIRFVAGLAERCDLTLATPAWEFQVSGLADRLLEGGARLKVDAIRGKRPAFQLRSFAYLLRSIRQYDVVLSQGMSRGSLNSTVAGRLMGVPVVTYESIAAVAYWRCRSERGSIGRVRAFAGELFIRLCLNVSGMLGTTAIALGPYLVEMTRRYSSRVAIGYYYGVDTQLYRSVPRERRCALRRIHGLPEDKYLILFSSRISHEKDPETALLAVAKARDSGLDAVVLNLGGGHREFLDLARRLDLRDAEQWVLARPAVHPMKNLCEYFQTADLVVQSSLEEGAGMAPLEALACGTPVVATHVGGMAVLLKDVAQLTPRKDADAMASAILWAARNPEDARRQVIKGQEYVASTWNRERAFDELMRVLQNASGSGSS